MSNGPVVTVTLSRALIDLFPGSEPKLTLAAQTVDDLIDRLDERYPGMANRIRDESPAIRRHLNIFVDGHKAALNTPLKPSSAVHILTAVSGG